MMVQQQQAVKTLDTAAVGTGVLAFFKTIPWPEIAGFCSVMYMLGRFVHWLYKSWKQRKGS